jgi:hypothetical protein
LSVLPCADSSPDDECTAVTCACPALASSSSCRSSTDARTDAALGCTHSTTPSVADEIGHAHDVAITLTLAFTTGRTTATGSDILLHAADSTSLDSASSELAISTGAG